MTARPLAARTAPLLCAPALAAPAVAAALLGAALLAPPAARAQHNPASVAFPAGARVVDVTAAPYGAVPDDGLDDTAAINQALADHPDANAIVYLPDGVYDVSDRIEWGPAQPGDTSCAIEQSCRYTVLQGQSRAGTVIRLADAAPGFQDPNSPRGVIWTGLGAAQRFRNGVRTLTVDTGSGNPGASGLQFKANNTGGVFDVTVRSGDGQGVAGLDFAYANEIGPLLVKGVEVVGFDVGVQTDFNVNSMTLEDLTLRDQNVYGMRLLQQAVTVRRLTSVNAVPAIWAFNQGSYVTVVDSELTGTAGGPAIVYGSGLFARDVATPGYDAAVRFNLNGTTPITVVEGPGIAEYSSAGRTGPAAAQVCAGPGASLRLPVQDAPAVPWDDPAGWASIEAFGAALDFDGVGANDDDTAAIQAALSSGASTVYVPASGRFPRRYTMDGDVVVPPTVRRILGTEGRIGGAGRFVVQAAGDPLVVERFQGLAGGLVHTSPRTLVVRETGLDYESAPGAGDVFLEGVVGGPFTFRGQRVWARQLNVENTATNVVNDGGDLWVLGLKTERRNTVIETINGGRTEVLGAMLYSTTPSATDPAFVVTDASASFAGVRETHFGSDPYPVVVRETRGAATRELLPGATGGSGVGGFGLPLGAFYAAAGPNAAPAVDAGPGASLLAPALTAALAGAVADDGLPSGACDVPFVQWRQVGGPPGAAFADAASPATTVTLPGPGTYAFELRADDGAAVSADTVEVVAFDAAVTTADGQGADADVRSGGLAGNNYGGAETMNVRRYITFHRKAYARFDLAGTPGEVADAAFRWAIATTNTGQIQGRTYNVFGLADGLADDGSGRLGEGWGEGAGTGGAAGAGEITWANAPGNGGGGGGPYDPGAGLLGGADPATTAFLGTFTTRPGRRDTVEFRSPALVDFLNADTDGLATLIVTRVEEQGGSISFAAKENALGLAAPTLLLQAAGPPVTQAQLDGADGYRMLAAPAPGSYGDLLGPLWTQGFAGADAPAGACTAFAFDEAAPTFADGWGCLADAADPLAPGAGLLAYAYADDDPTAPGLQGGFPKRLAVEGAPGALPFAFPLAYTADGRPAYRQGWNLLGNPTASALSWPAFDATSVLATAFVYDPAFNDGDYRSYTADGAGGGFGDLADGAIPAFQGFFVRATAPGAALTAPAGSEAATDPDVYGRGTGGPAAVRLALRDGAAAPVPGRERSAVWLGLHADAALGADAWDAPRLAPTAWPRAVAFTTAPGGGGPLLAQSLPRDLDGPVEVALGLDLGGHDGPLALALAWEGALPDGWALTLLDRATGAAVPMAPGATYAFEAAPSGSSGVAPAPPALARPDGLLLRPDGAAPRFAVRVTPPAAVASAAAPPAETALDPVAPNPARAAVRVGFRLAAAADVELDVIDATGRRVARLASGERAAGAHAAALDAAALSPGVYVVRLAAADRVLTRRLVVVR